MRCVRCELNAVAGAAAGLPDLLLLLGRCLHVRLWVMTKCGLRTALATSCSFACGISDTELCTITMCRAARRGKQIKDLAWFFIASCVFLFFIAAGAQRVPALDSGQWLPRQHCDHMAQACCSPAIACRCSKLLRTACQLLRRKGLDGLSLPVLSSPGR